MLAACLCKFGTRDNLHGPTDSFRINLGILILAQISISLSTTWSKRKKAKGREEDNKSPGESENFFRGPEASCFPCRGTLYCS